MAAIAEVIHPIETAPPVCLCPWLENPYRPVGLWDMLQFSARIFYHIGQHLERSFEDCLNAATGDLPIPTVALHGPIDDVTKRKALISLRWVETEAPKIGMPITASTASDTIRHLDNQSRTNTYQWLMDSIRHLQALIEKELSGKTFLYIPAEKMTSWPRNNARYVFGEAVHVAFPSADYDTSEAGVCLALSRSTASVFHLMRVLEISLNALGKLFGVSMAHTNWAPAIDQIESRIRKMHEDPAWKAMPDCKEQQEFYSQAASHFGILKDAWRNYTAHARGIYTEEQALLIFENVKAFVRTLATRLHE
jgi:hypothetical protein